MDRWPTTLKWRIFEYVFSCHGESIRAEFQAHFNGGRNDSQGDKKEAHDSPKEVKVNFLERISWWYTYIMWNFTAEFRRIGSHSERQAKKFLKNVKTNLQYFDLIFL